ncbi:hypothetical protein ACFSNO_14380 [Streptomyces cirratus]
MLVVVVQVVSLHHPPVQADLPGRPRRQGPQLRDRYRDASAAGLAAGLDDPDDLAARQVDQRAAGHAGSISSSSPRRMAAPFAAVPRSRVVRPVISRTPRSSVTPKYAASSRRGRAGR